jgi:cyclopropane fatty-acyl-phospholipid synthase-like methyltransferase
MFRTAQDGVFESSKNTNAALLRLLDQTRPVTKESVVLDLGSGHGGLSHEIAQTFGCKVISFNISPEQNQMNLDEAKRLGVGELISVRCGDFNDRANFPPSDLGEVTHVISCEVFCHAASKPNLLADVRKIVQPGAALVFTDIMGADGADEKALKDFTDRNATTAMARPSQYLDWLKAAGFCHVGFFDGSGHLLPYFSAMLDVCHKQGEAMVKDGVPQPYLDKWIASLTDRVAIQKDKAVFAWGLFSARAPGPLY